MKNIIQLAWNMNEFCYIMMIKFKLFQFEKMFNIAKITGNQVVHRQHMMAFFYKPIAKMRTQETGCPGYQYSFSFHFALVMELLFFCQCFHNNIQVLSYHRDRKHSFHQISLCFSLPSSFYQNPVYGIRSTQWQ